MGVAMYLIFAKAWKPLSHFKFWFLVFGFITYLLIGGLIFSLLDSKIEQKEINDLLEYKNKFYEEHKGINLTALDDLIQSIIDVANKGIYVPLNSTDSDEEKWKFGGETIFFTFTLLATIGYGHLSPLTVAGRLFCMGFIVIGVPITLLLLGNITEHLEFYLLKIGQKKRRVQQMPSYDSCEIRGLENTDSTDSTALNKAFYIKLSIVFLILVVFIFLLPAFVLSSYIESDWSFLEAIYYCFISITTIGLGDYVPGQNYSGNTRAIYRFIMTIYLLIGILTSMLFLNMFTRIPFYYQLSNSFMVNSLKKASSFIIRPNQVN